MLVRFGYHVLAQPQDDVLPVRHRLDAAHVHRLHLLDQAENVNQITQDVLGARVRNFDAREVRNAFDIVQRERHV
ncbi:hypothetical protein D3C83_08620 [compost metagenome]